MKTITLVLLILSIVAMLLGGLSDVTNRRYALTNAYYWNLGLYLLILAIFAEMHF